MTFLLITKFLHYQLNTFVFGSFSSPTWYSCFSRVDIVQRVFLHPVFHQAIKLIFFTATTGGRQVASLWAGFFTSFNWRRSLSSEAGLWIAGRSLSLLSSWLLSLWGGLTSGDTFSSLCCPLLWWTWSSFIFLYISYKHNIMHCTVKMTGSTGVNLTKHCTYSKW